MARWFQRRQSRSGVMTRWFRVYDDLVDDPKVQRLDPLPVQGTNQSLVPDVDKWWRPPADRRDSFQAAHDTAQGAARSRCLECGWAV
jgi:hypothetical protein